jgi:methionyl-tRNA formyltransferase
MKPSFLFYGKKGDPFVSRAAEFISLHASDSEIVLGKRGDVFPGNTAYWDGDVIISYLSPWIIPEYVLKKAKKAAINFHPGPPEYPGIGCTNFAIYNEERVFGVTCHHMAQQVDTGDIIEVKRFPVFATDTVFSITQQCYAHILSLFFDIVGCLLVGKQLPASTETWQRRPYRRAELDALCEIKADMSENEICRRVRAVTYPEAPGAFIQLAGFRFNKSNAEKH